MIKYNMIKCLVAIALPIWAALFLVSSTTKPEGYDCEDYGRCFSNPPWIEDSDSGILCMVGQPTYSEVVARDQECVCWYEYCLAESNQCMSDYTVTIDLAEGCAAKPQGYGCMVWHSGSSNEVVFNMSSVGCANTVTNRIDIWLGNTCDDSPDGFIEFKTQCTNAEDCGYYYCPYY